MRISRLSRGGLIKLLPALLLLVSCGRTPFLSSTDGGESSDRGDAGTEDVDAGLPADGGLPVDAGPIGTVCPAPGDAVETAWSADPSVCLVLWATGLPTARGIAFAPNGDLFVVTRSGVLALWDADGDGVSDSSERSVFSSNGGAHGIAFHDGYLYLSNPSTVWRFAYASGQRTASGPAETVVHDIPTGGHDTRTLVFDTAGRLIVNVGSATNVDSLPDGRPSQTRALLMRYDLSHLPTGGFSYTQGTVLAAGLRNEVGLALDRHGVLWGVENGRDQLKVAGVDIHNENPGEEINRFEGVGTFYGYPFCWSEYDWAAGDGRGTQHIDPDVPGGHNEAWCQDTSNVKPPNFLMPAHTAPLDLTFFDGSQSTTTGLSDSYDGDAFITLHGSWNRTPAVGRMILRARLDAQNNVVSADPFLGEAGPGGELAAGTWKYRPVSIKEGADGSLYFSDDNTGTIHRVVRKQLEP